MYCEEPHYSASCKRVTNPQKRREILQRKDRCFACLSFGDRGHECRSTKTCHNCKQRHHQSICGGFNTPLNTGTTVPVIEERTPDSSEVITNTTSGRNEKVLLQTAKACATNEDGTKSTAVRVLFDNGSQRSYVTNNLKSNLNWKPYKTETLHLNTFGEQRYRKQSCKEQLQMGIIEEVKEENSTEKFIENVHYLPHHAVLRHDRETTKVRIHGIRWFCENVW